MERIASENREKSYIDRILDMILLKDKYSIYLLALIVGGFILRMISAINISVFADDMHFAPGAINFLSSGKLIYWDQSSGLWFLITDLFYNLFGPTQLGSRFAAILFGTFTIPLVFLLAKEMFNSRKIGIIAAFLIAFSPFNVKSMMSEMDVMAMFFAFFSIYLFILAVNRDNGKLFALSGVLIGLSIYTKVYPLLFLPGMAVFLIYKNYKKSPESRNILKPLLIFGIAAFIFCIPELAHNYLLLKDKGIMDHQFTRVFGNESQKQMYSWMAGGDASAQFAGFFFGLPDGSFEGLPTSLFMLKQIFLADWIIFIFGILGLILMFFANKRGEILMFFLIFFLPFLYLGSVMLLLKHFLFISLFLVLPASYSLAKIHEKLSGKSRIFNLKLILILIAFASLFYSGVYYVNSSIYQKSPIQQLMEFKEANIDKDSLVIVDNRIYRGQIVWAFSNRHYLEANYLNELNSLLKDKPASSMNVYFVECSADDCGWGTVGSQPEFNKSMEDFTESFVNISEKVKVIPALNLDNSFRSGDEPPYFIVYQARVNLAPEALVLADSTHSWWNYPLGYNKKISPIFDDYNTSSSLGSFIDKTAHAIAKLSLILAFASILLLLYFAIKEI